MSAERIQEYRDASERVALRQARGITLDHSLAMAAAADAANKHMRNAGRTRWSRADYEVAVAELYRILGSAA